MKDKKKILKTIGLVGTGLGFLGALLAAGSEAADFVEKKDDLKNYNQKQLLIESRSSEEED